MRASTHHRLRSVIKSQTSFVYNRVVDRKFNTAVNVCVRIFIPDADTAVHIFFVGSGRLVVKPPIYSNTYSILAIHFYTSISKIFNFEKTLICFFSSSAAVLRGVHHKMGK